MTLDAKLFYMLRHEDAGGISGTGVVAVGCVFPNGRIVFQWVTYRTSMEFYDTMDNLIEVHGHEGKTEIIFGCPSDKPKKPRKKKSNG